MIKLCNFQTNGMEKQMVEGFTCFRWFLRIVPSGSGSMGSSASTLAGVNLFESRST